MASETQRYANRKATGRQVAMLIAIAMSKGIRGSSGRLLEWLEYESGLGLQLANIDDLPQSMVDQVKKKLEAL